MGEGRNFPNHQTERDFSGFIFKWFSVCFVSAQFRQIQHWQVCGGNRWRRRRRGLPGWWGPSSAATAAPPGPVPAPARGLPGGLHDDPGAGTAGFERTVVWNRFRLHDLLQRNQIRQRDAPVGQTGPEWDRRQFRSGTGGCSEREPRWTPVSIDLQISSPHRRKTKVRELVLLLNNFPPKLQPKITFVQLVDWLLV